jgi:hypothetical protein
VQLVGKRGKGICQPHLAVGIAASPNATAALDFAVPLRAEQRLLSAHGDASRIIDWQLHESPPNLLFGQPLVRSLTLLFPLAMSRYVTNFDLCASSNGTIGQWSRSGVGISGANCHWTNRSNIKLVCAARLHLTVVTCAHATSFCERACPSEPKCY